MSEIEINSTGPNSSININGARVLNRNEMKDYKSKKLHKDELEERLVEREYYIRTRKKRALIYHIIAAGFIVMMGTIIFEIAFTSRKQSFENYYTGYVTVKSHSSINKGISLRAHKLIETNEFKKAIVELKQDTTPEATYVLALCYMRTKEDSKAVKLFQKICNEKGLFCSEANEILEEHYYGYNTKN